MELHWEEYYLGGSAALVALLFYAQVPTRAYTRQEGRRWTWGSYDSAVGEHISQFTLYIVVSISGYPIRCQPFMNSLVLLSDFLSHGRVDGCGACERMAK